MYIDTHAHLYVQKFDEDRDQVMSRAAESGVDKILLPNIDAESVASLMDLHRTFPNRCLPMLGLHPCSVGQEWRKEVDEILDALSESVVGIGEIGIDLYWDTTFSGEQVDAYRHQIEVAIDLNLPIAVHSRDSLEKTVGIACEYTNRGLRGVFHCFTGGIEMGSQIVDAGFYLGIGGVITYKKNEELRKTLAQLPLESMVLETDAPYLPPVPFRGKRNESAYIPYVAKCLAALKEIPLESIGAATTHNARRLFNLE